MGVGVASAVSRLGVLGGTFDPIHNGHLAIAEEAQIQLGLDEVMVVPAGSPWLKADREVSSAAHRLAMVRLAVGDRPRLRVCDMEVRRPGPTYTVDTLEELRRHLGEGTKVYLLLGLDALMDIVRWRQPCRLFDMATLVGVPRPGGPGFNPAALDDVCPGASEAVELLDGPMLDLSGEDLRMRVSRGLPIGSMVPCAVNKYIRENGLYTDGTSPSPAGVQTGR